MARAHQVRRLRHQLAERTGPRPYRKGAIQPLKAFFLDLAVSRKVETLEGMMSRLPFEPYAPVRRQLLNLVRVVNKARKAAGFEPLAYSCVRMKRRIVRPFETNRPFEGHSDGGAG